MTRRPALLALLRTAHTAFFLATTAYCLLAYIPFAYQVFLKPEVLPWIPDFLATHTALFWLVFLTTTLTLKPYLGSPDTSSPFARMSLARWVALAYVGAGAALGAVLLVRPVMNTVDNSPRSLAIGVLALVPPIWLAAFDHLAAPFPPIENSGERQVLRTCLLSAVCVWGVYAVGVPFRLRHVVGVDLPVVGLLVSWGASAVLHLFVFTAALLALVTMGRVARLARSGGQIEYWLIVVGAGAAAAFVTYELIFESLTFVGARAMVTAAAVGGTVVLAWSGVARWRGAASASTCWTALELFLAPISSRDSRAVSLLTIVLLPFAAYGLAALTSTLDWNFIIQKLGVLFIWLVAFACAHALGRRRVEQPAGIALAIVPILAFTLFQGAESLTARARMTQVGPLNPDFLFDRYAAVDLSFHLIRDQRVQQSRDTADFYTFLKAHTLVAPPRVSPGAIRFATGSRSKTRSPHVFLFVIDSLRRDYLSPYNPAATFTPSIAGFASDSFVFRRAFTRYSGTGLAIPSLWAGGMLIHMIVQRPFDGRDALLNLLDGAGYRLVMGIDSVMRDLLPERTDILELDHGVPSMMTDFCQTTQQLRDELTASAGDTRPVFSYTLPQNVHIAVASKHQVPPDVSYPGFFGPVADTVREVDRCFGEFVSYLKQSRLYDDSIVILTSDHGDSLGEEGRWGHSYFMVPEVMRIPLIVHLPASLRARVTTDLSRVAFSTDITPTLYELLGEEPADLGTLFGAPLFVPSNAELLPRRRQSFLLASSYGAVYGMLRHNGRKLYAADAIDGHDDAYDMSADWPAQRIAITQAMLSLNRRLISEQLNELAALNHFTPQPLP
jgi:hypothetical protein